MSPGNPDDDNPSASGSTSGVIIHLERLKGISPLGPQDREKVENATAAEFAEWSKDLHFSQVTDENGSVKFSGLLEDIYLVTSTAPNDSYRGVNSFLVSTSLYDADYDFTLVEGVIMAKSHKPGETPPSSMLPATPLKTPPTTSSGISPTTPGASIPPEMPPMTPTTPITPGKPGASTTTLTTSTIPGESGTPTPLDSPDSSLSSGSSGRSGSLAPTNVQIAGLVAVTATLIGGGFAIIATNKKNPESGEN